METNAPIEATETDSTTQTTDVDAQNANDGVDQGNVNDKGQVRGADGKFRSPVQPRIDELTRDREDARREAAYWRTRAEAEAAERTKAAAAPAEIKKPVPDDFDDYGAYVEALTDWKAEVKVNEKLDTRERRTAEERQQHERVTNWATREEAARKAIPDYDEVMGRANSIPVAPHVVEQLLDADRGPEVAAHLARHPEIADKLNKMTPVQAAREIGKIEAKLPDPVASNDAAGDDTTTEPNKGDDGKGTQPAAQQGKPPVKTTTAPAPAKTAGQSRSTTVPLEKMGMDEYVAARKAQGAQWARR